MTGVADCVLREVLRDHAQHLWPKRDVDVGLAFDRERDACARGGPCELLQNAFEHRQRSRVTERHDLAAALEFGEEEDLVDQSAGVLDLGPCLVDEGANVRIGEIGRIEQREDARERRAELVGDRCRESGAQLVEAPRVRVVGVDVHVVVFVGAWASLVCVEIRHQMVTIPTPGPAPSRLYRRGVTKVLIIEDDNVIADGMARHLSAGGFDPIVVGRGELGLTRLRYENPDVCVLDLMLPELDGWKLIETARAEGIGTPIVVVSARGTEHDRVHALDLGADDYLVKPFSMRELVARVGAAARRGVRPAEEKRGDPIEIEELRIDPREVQAYVDGRSAALTPTEFKLLYTLALDRGRVVTRDELLQKVWGRRETHRDRTVDVFVRRLRQKVDKASSKHSFIQTRFGVGYKLEPEPK